MKRAKDKIPYISEEEPVINEFYTLNTFGPHAALRLGELRELINFDIYGQYIKTRRGSERMNRDHAPVFDIVSWTTFDAGDDEYLIIQNEQPTTSDFHFIKLGDKTTTWAPVVNKSDGSDFTITLTKDDTVADMMMSNGKVYVFHADGNYVLEWNSTNVRFESRKMGLPAPQIHAWDIAPVPEALKGKRVYAVELVYKDTSVTPNVDIIVSGPNRAVEVSGTVEFNEGRLAIIEGDEITNQIWVSKTLNDGTLITDTVNENWTHIRLYRSLDVTTATNAVPELEGPAEIMGRYDEVFQVQEMDKATFLATWDAGDQVYKFAYDSIPDDEIPFPLDVITGDRLELYPIPAATTGAFHRNRIWASGIIEFPGPSGVLQLEDIESKIFFSPEAFTKYSESVQALSAIEADPGDGQKMIRLTSLEEDLIGIKEGKTGRVPRGDPDSGWITEDEAVGIDNKKHAQYVPRVGICALVNDQYDFRIFGFDLTWRSTFANLQISRPIRDIIKGWRQAGQTDFSFMYMNGKLFLNGGQAEFLVLATEQQRGWSRYQYPLNSLSEGLFPFAEGTRAGIVNRAQQLVEIEIDTLETDFNTATETDQYIDWELTTHKWQDNGGRSIIEHRWLSIVAILEEQIAIQAYVNGRIWSNPFGVLLDPAEYPHAELQETEYQGYAEIKPIGNYVHYHLSGNKPATIYSIMLNCLIQRGNIAPGFDPFEILDLATRVPPWASAAGDYVETGVADIDIVESGARTTEIVEGQ